MFVQLHLKNRVSSFPFPIVTGGRGGGGGGGGGSMMTIFSVTRFVDGPNSRGSDQETTFTHPFTRWKVLYVKFNMLKNISQVGCLKNFCQNDAQHLLVYRYPEFQGQIACTNILLFKAWQPEFKTDFSQATLYHRVRNKIIFILI